MQNEHTEIPVTHVGLTILDFIEILVYMLHIYIYISIKKFLCCMNTTAHGCDLYTKQRSTNLLPNPDIFQLILSMGRHHHQGAHLPCVSDFSTGIVSRFIAVPSQYVIKCKNHQYIKKKTQQQKPQLSGGK